MGCITPPPSVVQAEFAKRIRSRKEATNYYYQFSQATNYIRKDRIAKDEKWVTDTEYGPIDITINLSKPEKDPRDIAKAGQAKSDISACLLCKRRRLLGGHFSPGKTESPCDSNQAGWTELLFAVFAICILLASIASSSITAYQYEN